MTVGGSEENAVRYKGMDGIKGMALVAILWYHLSASSLPGGFVGVETFFTLSGFLLGASLLRSLATRGNVSLGRFYARRFLRLWPALAFMVCAVLSVGALMNPDTIVGARGKAAAALGFATNWHEIATGGSYFASTSPQLLRHLWFVSLLAQATLVLPLLVVVIERLVPARLRIAVPVGLAVLSAVLMGVLFRPDTDPTRVYYGTDTHCFAFLLGLALAWVLHTVSSWRAESGRENGENLHTVSLSSERLAALGRAIAPWAATAAMVGLFVLCHRLGQDASAFRGGLALGAVLSIVLILGTIWPGSWMETLFSWRPLALLGRYSYGMYLWHWPLFLLVSEALPGCRGGKIWRIWVLTLALSVIMTAVSWLLVERPIAKLTDRWTRRGSGEGTGAGERNGAEQGRSLFAHPWLRIGVSSVAAVALIAGFANAMRIAPDKSSVQIMLERNQAQLEDEAAQRVEDAKAAEEARKRAEEEAKAHQAAKEEIAKTLNGDQVSVVGDSVAVGAAPAIKELMPGAVVDAKTSRFIWEGADVVTSLKAQGALRRFVVVSLNTNGMATTALFDQIAAAAGPDHVLVLVTGHGDRSWIPASNQASVDYVTAHAGSAALADWNAAASAHPELLASDGIHTGAEGGKLYAQTIKDAIAGFLAAQQTASSAK